MIIFPISWISAHQTHYEQFGELRGKLIIENRAEMLISLQGVRDHSYGNFVYWLPRSN